mmetsp:Transcript_15254/g.26684  ORF Transcript_15254/g.26684 Transcript_15254/m.26684 type:complete len:376 (+) Transcript_15254:91-1218(+)|eukprot:CAMPEP_0171494566 /NCGR_PEP_ID=MMETSP0958-20121227/5630_1 /TAXON_ID=87120 /ORGANISM="Aurantiochytrium limacinum, Strain ATCCMYA-1381" /LENGTH=375 /DNA_ID=CAMNT_0012028397 /DNA_START=81 /DNA_END=1208 /DNA_ORIENTATION=+
MTDTLEEKSESGKVPFEPLWRKNERSAQKSGTRHTIYWVKKNPKYQEYERDGALVSATQPAQFKTGATYSGDWLEDCRHGFGTQTSPKGTKYQGDFKNNKRDGTGTLWKREEGKLVKQYTGEWKSNKRHGLGIHFYTNGDKYEGEWQNGKRHGRGKLFYSNGDQYDGEFVEDERSGLGIMMYANGNWYEGHFDRGVKHGPGRYFFVDTGKVLEAEWVEGSAKCGSYFDAPKDAVPDGFSAGISQKQKFTLPRLGLDDPNQVLKDALHVARQKNGQSSAGTLGQSPSGHYAIGKDSTLLHGFDIEEYDDIRTAFGQVDTKQAGFVLGGQLEHVLNNLGIYPLQGDMEQLLIEIGAHRGSQLSLDHIVRLLAALREE